MAYVNEGKMFKIINSSDKCPRTPSSTEQKVGFLLQWKFDESGSMDYALSNPPMRSKIRALLFTSPLTMDQFLKGYQSNLQKMFPELVERESSGPHWKTIIKMWILHTNFRDGMRHLLVNRPTTAKDNAKATITHRRLNATPKRHIYMTDSILTRCFLGDLGLQQRVSRIPRPFKETVDNFLQMSSYNKRQMKAALLPIWQTKFQAMLPDSLALDPDFEWMKSIFYAQKMDKIMVPYLVNRSLQHVEADLLSIHLNAFRGVCEMVIQVDPGAGSRLGIGQLDVSSQMYLSTYQLVKGVRKNTTRQTQQGDNMCIFFAKADAYNWLYTLEHSVIPEQLENPRCILLPPLLKIVFSFLLGGG